MDLKCPECGSTEVAGIEYRGVYDGVARWCCMSCTHEWNRFPDDHYVTQRLNKHKEVKE